MVVRHVVLHRGDPPQATGGTLHEIRPWPIEPDALRPVAYGYTVPARAYQEADAFPAEFLA